MIANDIEVGTVMTKLTGLILDRDGKPLKINPRVVFEVISRRTGLVKVRAYPVGSKVNKVIKGVYLDQDKRERKMYEEIPSNLEIWEVPVAWEVK